jgi:hypothetical protein
MVDPAHFKAKSKVCDKAFKACPLYSNAQEKPIDLANSVGSAFIAAMQSISVALTDRPKTLTECCRELSTAHDGAMSAVDVKHALQAAGFDFSTFPGTPQTRCPQYIRH